MKNRDRWARQRRAGGAWWLPALALLLPTLALLAPEIARAQTLNVEAAYGDGDNPTRIYNGDTLREDGVIIRENGDIVNVGPGEFVRNRYSWAASGGGGRPLIEITGRGWENYLTGHTLSERHTNLSGSRPGNWQGLTTGNGNSRLVNDSTDEEDVTITLTPGNFTPGPALTFTIADDDYGVGLGVSTDGGATSETLTITEGDSFVLHFLGEPGVGHGGLSVNVDNTGAGTYGSDVADNAIQNGNLATDCTIGEMLNQPCTEFTRTLSTDPDDRDEENGTLVITVADGAGYVPSSRREGAWTSVTVTIEDDDDTVVGITAPATQPVKEGDTILLDVWLIHPLGRDLRVEINLSGGAGFGIEDGATTTTILAGAATTTLSVPIPDDGELDTQATLTAAVRDIGTYLLHPTDALAEVTLRDNSLGLWTTISPATVSESGTATFTLNATRAPGEEMSFMVEFTGGATFGVAENARQTVTLGANATTTLFGVPTDDGAFDNDSVEEADGTLIATVIDGDGFYLTADAPAQATIQDDDLLVEMAAETATVTEGGTVNITLSVSENVATNTEITVNVEGGAAFGIADGATTTTILAGGRTAVVSLDTDNDTMDDADTTLTVTVGAVRGYTADRIENISNPLEKATATAEVALEDNDLLVWLSAGGYFWEEGPEGFNIITVRREHSTPDPLPVNIRLSGAADYVDGDFTVTIPADEESVGLPLDIEQDRVDDPDATLSAAVIDGAGYVWDDLSDISRPIFDHDIEVSVSTSSAPVEEGSQVVFILRTSSPVPSVPSWVSVDVNVEFSVSGGDYGIDLDPMTPEIETTGITRTVTFSSGDTVARLTFDTKDAADTADDADGNVKATVLAGTGYIPGSSPTATAIIRDDDIEVSIRTGAAPVDEGSPVVFTVELSSPTSRTIEAMVRLQTNHELPNGGDYGLTDLGGDPIGADTTRTVAIASGTEGTLTLDTKAAADRHDDLDGNLRATVVAAAGYIPAASSSATATLRDDDIEIINVTVAGNTKITEGGTIEIGIHAKSPVPRDVVLNVNYLDGSQGAFRATGDVPLPGTEDNPSAVTLRAMESSLTLTWGIVDNPLDTADADADFTLTVLPHTNDYLLTASPPFATVQILNNDFTVGIAIDDDEIQEGERVNFTVNLSAPIPVIGAGDPLQHLRDGLVVNYRVTVNDGLTDAGDFGIEAHEGTLTIAPGARSALSSSLDSADLEKLLAAEDNVREANGAVTVTILDGTGYTVSTAAPSDTVTVTDPPGDPDVNKDGNINANDALILYYAYSLRGSLGTGR